jgi:hypothetical protein
MPTITLAVQEAGRAGLTPAYTAAGASPLLNVVDTFTFNNTGREILHVKKSGAGACDVTIVAPGTVDGLAVADRVVQVPATTGDKLIGPFPPSIYNAAGSSQLAGFTLSEVTGLSVAVIRVP